MTSAIFLRMTFHLLRLLQLLATAIGTAAASLLLPTRQRDALLPSCPCQYLAEPEGTANPRSLIFSNDRLAAV